MNLATTQPSSLSRIKPTLEFLGSTSILVILMGLPATVHHYSTLNIPIALLSYRRVLEAGVFPATLVVLFLIYLFWVERKTSGLGKSVLVGVADSLSRKRLTNSYLSIPAIPFIIPAILVILAGVLAGYLWMFWAIGWVLERPIIWFFDEFALSDRWTAIIGISVVAISTMGIYLRGIKSSKREIETGSNQTHEDKSSIRQPTEKSKINVGRRPARDHSIWASDFPRLMLAPKTLNESLIGSLLAYLTIPPMIFLFAYLIKTVVQLFDFPWPVSFTQENMILSAGFMGIAYAHFMSAESFAKFVSSQNEKTNEGAKIARRGTYSVFIVASIMLYSLYIYPHLPRGYGGGHPEILNIVTKASVIPGPLKPLFTTHVSDNIYIDNVQLIDKTSDEVILCKEQKATPICLALPSSSIVSMSWKYTSNIEVSVDGE